MNSPDTLARIRSHLLALQQEAGASDESNTDLLMWQERLDRLERAMDRHLSSSAPTSSTLIGSELRANIRMYAGYPARFVAYAELIPEWTVRDVRLAMSQTAEHGLPTIGPKIKSRPVVTGDNTTQGVARGWS